MEYQETKDFWTKFNIQDAKELQPLRKSFVAYAEQINQMEGRTAQKSESFLKEADFWKLFFEAGESFSATGGKYQARPWPPVVTLWSQKVQEIRLTPEALLPADERPIAEIVRRADPNQPVKFNLFNYSERPFLFWKVAEEAPLVPEKLDQVRKQVVEAWKLDKARETILLPRARKIAETAAKSPVPGLTLHEALAELKKEYPAKGEISRWAASASRSRPRVQDVVGTTRIYKDFELPKGYFTYPRKDMAANLLNLYDLKKAIEVGYKPLDNINKALYEQTAKEKNPQGKYIQILTNQPHTTFWVATVTGPPQTDELDFVMAAKGRSSAISSLSTAGRRPPSGWRGPGSATALFHKVEAPATISASHSIQRPAARYGCDAKPSRSAR